MMIEDNKTNTVVDFDPFSGDIIEKIVPATESQKEVFASCILGGQDANLAYNESLSVYFTGKLNEEVLRESIVELHQRHESFRATFTEDGSKMIIYESKPPHLHYEDLETLDPSSQQSVLEKYLDDDARSAFDLFNGPLTRIALFRLNAGTHALVITAHHIVCDGWSCGTLLEDLSRLYNAKCAGLASPEKPLLFSDYAMRSLQYEQSAEYQEVLNYWKKEYEGSVPVFEIPPDFPRPALRTYKGRRDDFILAPDIAELAKKTGAKYGCGFVTTLMSAFELLLYKYTGNPDIVVGLPTAGQGATEMYDLIGHCVNFLPLRSNPDPKLSFAEYLKKRKSKTLKDYEYQQFTFGALLKELKIERDPSRIPLTPMSFNIDIGMNKQVAFDNLAYRVVLNKRVAETFEVFLKITNCDNGYEFQWSYNTQLFKPSTIAGLMEKYTYLLKQVSENPDMLISDMRLVDEDIILDQLKDWNQTFKLLPDATVIELFESEAHRSADHIALKFDTEEFSYRRLNEQANRMANFLLSQGIKKGDIVGIVLERGPYVIISLLAVLKCGAAYLPIDPEFPEDRIKLMLEDSEAAFVLINKDFSAKLNTLASKHIIIEDMSAAIQEADTSDPGVKVAGNALAYLLYTSGSTGKPKGVMVSQNNLLNFLLGMKDIFRTGAHTRLLSVTTISFDIAGLEIFLPLISGGQLILADKKATKDSKALIELLSTEQINIMQATPATYKLMLQEKWPRNQPLTLLCGGEALPKKIADSLLQKCGRLFNMYGPTETTIWSTVKEINAEDEFITIGRPIQNTSVYILDENRNVLSAEAEGEIFIGGEGVALGYYKRPELTAERFIPDPFSDKEGARLYGTGDLGKYLTNGELICLGRSDNQAKIRGYRIELEEIEHYISKIEGIKDAVVKVEDTEGADQKLVAYIVPSNIAALNGGEVTKNEIISWRRALGKSLPDYMIPNVWAKLKEFPLTPNKKVDRKALKYRDAGTGKAGVIKDVTDDFAEIVEKIKRIWEEVIGIKGIEPDDNFFELGGHSMIAIKVMTEIEKETGAKLPISALFENATIKSLAEVIHDHRKIDYSKVVIPIKSEGRKKPIFIVHARGLNIMLYKSLGQYLDEDQPLYGLQGLGMDDDLTHLKDMESIAKRYLSEVLEYNADGPYIIIGYSFGGLVAFEMAKQLLAMGKEIKMLGILDTDAYMGDKYKSKLKLYTVKGLRQFKKVAFYIKQLIKTPQTFFKYQWIYLKKTFSKNYIPEVEDELEIYDYGEEVVQAYEKAYYSYELEPIDAHIDLFKAAHHKPVYFHVDPEYHRWGKYTLKGLRRHIVPGDHTSILRPPNNISLARAIQNVINDKS